MSKSKGGRSQEQIQKQAEESGEAQTTSLDASYVDVAVAAAAGGLGAAAAAGSLSDRPPTPAPPQPPPEEETIPLIVEEQEETLSPQPTVEDESPETIQVETVIPEAECQELEESGRKVQPEPTEPEFERESPSEQPHPQSYALDSYGSDNPRTVDEDTTGISESGVLVPEHVTEETTQPGTSSDDLGGSVVLVSHTEQPFSPSSLPHDGPSNTTSSIPDFGITPLPSLTSTHIHPASTTILSSTSTPTDPKAEAEAEHLASETTPLSGLNSDSDSDSLPDSEPSDSEDEAEREWRESLKELELLASMVLVPFLGKWVGRRCAYWDS
ncbi:hypothetical protein EV426DRAFT_428683 [Tirmania nivea]|nr:hypothetical protein EV426DRAFT_428683 [Tirmania nivea]